MNIKPIALAAALLALSSGAIASTPGEQLDYPYPDQQVPSTLKRADVRSVAISENAKHALVGEAGSDVDVDQGPPASTPGLTRAEVRKETLAAIADGTAPGPGDDPGYPDASRSTATKPFDAADHPKLAHLVAWITGRKMPSGTNASD